MKAIVLKGTESDIEAAVESLVSMCVPWLPSDVDAKEIKFSYTLTESRLSDIIGLDVKDIVKAFEECFFYYFLKKIIDGFNPAYTSECDGS